MPAVPPRIRITAVSSTASQLGIFAWHIHCNVGIAVNMSPENLDTIAENYSNWLAEDYKNALQTAALFLGLRVRYEAANPAGDVEVKYDGDQGLGTWPEPGAAPAQLAGLLRKRAAESGRHARGRMYIPFPPADAAAADGTCSAAYKVALTQVGNIIMQPRSITLDGVPVMFYPAIFAANRAAQGYRIIDISRADNFATQRRRGAFGRPNVPAL